MKAVEWIFNLMFVATWLSVCHILILHKNEGRNESFYGWPLREDDVSAWYIFIANIDQPTNEIKLFISIRFRWVLGLYSGANVCRWIDSSLNAIAAFEYFLPEFDFSESIASNENCGEALQQAIKLFPINSPRELAVKTQGSWLILPLIRFLFHLESP